MAISFNGIPAIRTPGQYVELDNSKAFQGLPLIPNRILVLGQRLAAGTVAAGVPTRVQTLAQAQSYFGRGSMLAAQLEALLGVNATTETWAIALDDNGAGVAATGTFTMGGAPTAAGTLNAYVAGRRVQVAVASGAAVNAVAAALAAAISADADMPVTANAVAAVVTVTARHKGEVGNTIDLRVNYAQGEALPAGLTCAVAAMAGGTSNPDLAAAIAALGATWYATVAHPYVDATSLAALEQEMARRSGPLVQIPGVAFTAMSGTQGTLSTLGDTRNSERSVILGTGKSPTPPYAAAAILAGVDAFQLSDPTAINRPRQTLPLTGMKPPAAKDQLTRAERDLLLGDGIATFIVDAGGNCLVERVVTTYQTNPFGAIDPSYQDVETVRTVDYLRFSLANRIALKFPRHKLASDGTRFGAGQAIVTPSIIRAEIIALFRQWEDQALAENIDQFKAQLIVERDANDANRVNAYVPPDVVNQFRVFAAVLGFRL
jgi:phage tail sheath gpL-like